MYFLYFLRFNTLIVFEKCENAVFFVYYSLKFLKITINKHNVKNDLNVKAFLHCTSSYIYLKKCPEKKKNVYFEN